MVRRQNSKNWQQDVELLPDRGPGKTTRQFLYFLWWWGGRQHMVEVEKTRG